jgi:hypothetical protein
MIDEKMILEIKEIFNSKMFECETKSGETLMCSLNDAFNEFHENGHNCLGCNLEDHAVMIFEFLDSSSHNSSELHFFTIYNFLLYLLTERILEIKKIIGLPEGYRQDKFHIFKEIRLWANFAKHPKAFILTHHPTYVFEESKDIVSLTKEKKQVNIEYLKKYYSGEDKNKYNQLVKELRNRDNIVVVLPELRRYTIEFCEACKEFISIIHENKAYREILNDVSTLENYFEKEIE